MVQEQVAIGQPINRSVGRAEWVGSGKIIGQSALPKSCKVIARQRAQCLGGGTPLPKVHREIETEASTLGRKVDRREPEVLAVIC
jgi:hypothetical protein